MTRIEIQEEKDREIVKNLFDYLFESNIVDNQLITDRTDLKITGFTSTQTGIYNIEVKERTFSSDKYDTSFIEADKYEQLMSDSNYTPLYIVIYSDLIVIWNLNKINLKELKKEFKKMNKTTYSINSIEKVWKEVYHLPLDQFNKKYKRNNYAVD
jgi:hypothetical protein